MWSECCRAFFRPRIVDIFQRSGYITSNDVVTSVTLSLPGAPIVGVGLALGAWVAYTPSRTVIGGVTAILSFFRGVSNNNDF